MIPPRHSAPDRVCLRCYLCWFLLDKQREDESLDSQLYEAYINQSFAVVLPPSLVTRAAFMPTFSFESYEIFVDVEKKMLLIDNGLLFLLEEVEAIVGEAVAETINMYVASLVA